jgi:hypothetical protein
VWRTGSHLQGQQEVDVAIPGLKAEVAVEAEDGEAGWVSTDFHCYQHLHMKRVYIEVHVKLQNHFSTVFQGCSWHCSNSYLAAYFVSHLFVERMEKNYEIPEWRQLVSGVTFKPSIWWTSCTNHWSQYGLFQLTAMSDGSSRLTFQRPKSTSVIRVVMWLHKACGTMWSNVISGWNLQIALAGLNFHWMIPLTVWAYLSRVAMFNLTWNAVPVDVARM